MPFYAQSPFKQDPTMSSYSPALKGNDSSYGAWMRGQKLNCRHLTETAAVHRTPQDEKRRHFMKTAMIFAVT